MIVIYRDYIFAIKNGDGRILTDPTEKAKLINFYYSSIFSSEDNVLHIQRENTSDPFTIDIKAIKVCTGCWWGSLRERDH
jgi:hypothetical protein